MFHNFRSILIDHTTSTPNLAVKIQKEAAEKGVFSVDAPVSGGDVGAKSGQLVIMCGGDEEGVEKVKPLLECYGKSVEHFGAPGNGQHNKMANQIVLAGNMIGMAEGLLYANKMGLDIKQSIKAISVGGAASTALSVMGKRVADGDFDPGFYV